MNQETVTMHRKRLLAFGLAGLFGASVAWAQAPINSARVISSQPVMTSPVSVLPSSPGTVVPGTTVITSVAPSQPMPGLGVPGMPTRPGGTIIAQEQGNGEGAPADTAPPADPAAPAPGEGEATGEAAQESGGYGPTPIQNVHILQNWLRGLCGKDCIKDPPPPKKEDPCAPKCEEPKPQCPDLCKPADDKPCLQILGWIDFDYTYRSIGSGVNNVAPVMNRFGNEFLNRQDGISISKLLDPKSFSWGFNAIFIAGSDAAFLNPTEGWIHDPNPRFSVQFTDLNLTAHLPILTEGGVDLKIGRQTTILGPMGAIPWQRWFDSSDYAWYNMEEGRYTGASSVWHVNKQLDWYNGFELGWGTFYDQISGGDIDYITNISYWLDEDAKKHKVWTTVLTGPTSKHSGKVTTVFELGFQENWSDRWYQIIDTQMVWSKGPVDQVVPPGYLERAYDVYTYLGYHLNKCVDLQSRFEWYEDVDGRSYAGGFGVPGTDYYEITLGVDYHPVKWLQVRPEVRWDHATKPNFGADNNHKDELTIAGDVLIKF